METKRGKQSNSWRDTRGSPMAVIKHSWVSTSILLPRAQRIWNQRNTPVVDMGTLRDQRSHPFSLLGSIKMMLAPVHYQLREAQTFLAPSLSTTLQSPRALDSYAHTHIPLIPAHCLDRKEKETSHPSPSLWVASNTNFLLTWDPFATHAEIRDTEVSFFVLPSCSFTMTTANGISKDAHLPPACAMLSAQMGPRSENRVSDISSQGAVNKVWLLFLSGAYTSAGKTSL